MVKSSVFYWYKWIKLWAFREVNLKKKEVKKNWRKFSNKKFDRKLEKNKLWKFCINWEKWVVKVPANRSLDISNTQDNNPKPLKGTVVCFFLIMAIITISKWTQSTIRIFLKRKIAKKISGFVRNFDWKRYP